MSNSDSYLAIGKIHRPHGVRGELRVTLYNSKSSLLEELGAIFIGSSAKTIKSFSIESLRPTHKGILLKLQGIDDVDAADTFRGANMWIDKNDLPALDEGEFYHYQLVGLEVFDHQQKPVGSVTRVEEGSGSHILHVKGTEEEHLLPLIDDAIDTIDLKAKRIDLKNMPGLLDNGF